MVDYPVEYQIRNIGNFRTKKILSIGFISVGGELIWTNQWFKYINTYQQEYQIRYLHFDDGWSYRNYWGGWITKWKFIKIV